MRWWQTTIFALDFEGSRKSGVVEIGAAAVRDGEIAETFTALCAPKSPPTERETRCHGLDAAALRAAPAFGTFFARFRQMRLGGLLAAHNAATERRLLCDAFPHPGIVPDFLSEGHPAVSQWGPWIDTCALYRRLYPDLPSHALGDLVALFRLEDALEALAAAHCPKNRRKAHCALYDALAAALLLGRLREVPEVARLGGEAFRALADPFSPRAF